ncbi:MAG: hypothetical protein LC732_00970 [Acidobacteria bacterium]|nr:hypothetical protein [Acidobacteriota bacterium]
MSTGAVPAPSSRTVFTALTVWFFAAFVLSAMGYVRGALPLGIVASLTVACGIALLSSESAQKIAAHGSLRGMVGFHLIRILAGIAFLSEAAAGRLPRSLAIGAGFGDIVVGLLAIPLLVFAFPIDTELKRRVVLAWNAVALADILLVLIGGAAMIGARSDAQLRMTELPMSLLPTFVVPLVLVTHGIIFWRLLRKEREPLP